MIIMAPHQQLTTEICCLVTCDLSFVFCSLCNSDFSVL